MQGQRARRWRRADPGTHWHGVEVMMGTYNMLDLVPKGRDEDDLPYTMVWVRHHDRYEPAPPAGSCCHSNTW